MLLKDTSDIIKFLNKDLVVILPTDTIYGFSCLLKSSVAISDIISIKEREGKPLLVIDSDLNRVKSYFKKDKYLYQFIDKLVDRQIWPNQVTIIAEKATGVKGEFLMGYNTIAVRYTNYHIIKDVTTYFQQGLLSSSVNITGEKELVEVNDIIKKFPNIPVFMHKMPTTNTTSSTMVYYENGKFKIVRYGLECVSKKVKELIDESH